MGQNAYDPELADVRLDRIYLSPIVLVPVGAQAILDENGRSIRDEKGNEIHGN